jgi:hypothetical protein
MAEIVLDVDPWQLQAINDPAREKLIVGGRGTGKTVGVLRNWFIQKGLDTLDGEFAYFGPSYAVGMRERKSIAKNRFLKPYITDTGDQPFPYIKWATGTSTYFRSMDREENLLGYHLDGGAIDEAHRVGERALDEIVRPQLAAKRGTLFLVGQHDEDGEEGWIQKRFFLPGQDMTQNRVRSWRIPASMGRMYQGEDGRAELEHIRKTTPDLVFRWQYLAEAIETGNRAFRSEDVRACRAGRVEERGDPGAGYVGGYDLGKVVDPSACVILKALTSEKCRVVHASLRPLLERHENQALWLQRQVRVFCECAVLIDSTGGATGGHGSDESDAYVSFYRDLIPSARSFFITNRNKAAIIQSLQLAVEQKRIEIPVECEELAKQLVRYRWERKQGAITFSGPNGHEDDLTMALAMAFYGFERGFYGGSSGVRGLAEAFA